MEEKYGHLDSGEVGYSLFGDSPLTTPELTPPPSPALPSTSLDGLGHPLVGLPALPDPPPMLGDSPSIAADPPGNGKTAGKKHRSNKMRSHAKRKRARANERTEREEGGLPYDVRASTRLKHVHPSIAVHTNLNLADIPISAPGYIGLRDKNVEKDATKYKLEDLVGGGSRFKFKYQKWDGR